MDKEYIEREATLIEMLHEMAGTGYQSRAMNVVHYQPAADVAEVKHGEWTLDVHSFYNDTYSEESELSVYILASCSRCGERHPNGCSGQVFSKTVYAPEGQEFGYKFDQDYEKSKAIEEFKQRKYEFKNYCPNCGAKMDTKEGVKE